MKTKTDNKWHDFRYAYEVPEKILRTEFDWLEVDEADHFILYKGSWYHLSQFQRIKDPTWDGALGFSYYSGLVIKVSKDGERYKIGAYTG